jgi:hypothetical protein
VILHIAPSFGVSNQGQDFDFYIARDFAINTLPLVLEVHIKPIKYLNDVLVELGTKFPCVQKLIVCCDVCYKMNWRDVKKIQAAFGQLTDFTFQHSNGTTYVPHKQKTPAKKKRKFLV